jgi:mutator protein MutT
VLIAQRPPGKHMAGAWEFPGGKLDLGEGRVAGLARELHEELGITITAPRPLLRLRHRYPDREVMLDVWVVLHYTGDPVGLEGQVLRWCAREHLETADLLPADMPIVAALRLPEKLVRLSSNDYAVCQLLSKEAVAGANYAHSRRLIGAFCGNSEQANAAVIAGFNFVVMSAVLPNEELRSLCRRVDLPVFAKGSSLAEAWDLGATGISEID